MKELNDEARELLQRHFKDAIGDAQRTIEQCGRLIDPGAKLNPAAVDYFKKMQAANIVAIDQIRKLSREL